jgi:Polyketide cyclase / dehydrase and lipid transport
VSRAQGDVVREHGYSFEIPQSAARIWALFQDYDRWTEYAPMVKRVDVLWPGDEHHNGRLRRVIYQTPFGREGAALELVTEVVPERGYTYTMISREPGNDQTGKIRLEPLGPNRTRFHFEERYHLTKAPWKWFERPIYRFINKKNEESMRRAAEWLSAHPEYRSDLVASEPRAEQADT